MATIRQKQDLAIAEETALRRFLSGREDLDALPGASGANVHQLPGIVRFDDVRALYRQPRNLRTANRDKQ